jgi:ABC-2 type transport system permease protein
MHGLYDGPFYGWFLLVSAWARRAAFLWAFVPLFAIAIVEKIAFNSAHFANFLASRVGGPSAIPYPPSDSMAVHDSTLLMVASFLTSPGLWIGLAVTGIFLALAVRLRRYREPI